MRHLLTIAGNRGTPTPVYSSLTQKLIDLGAVEVWPMDDASGGAKAVVNSDHNLLETDGTNIAYGYEFENFPDVKGIDLSAASGDATYLRSGSSVSALRLVGDMSLVFALNSAAYYAWFYPTVGMFAQNDGTADTNSLWGSGIATATTRKITAVFDHGINVEQIDEQQVSQNAVIRDNADLLCVVVRDTTGKTYDFYINGEYCGSDTWISANPSGGSATEMVVGRGNSRLTTSERHRARYASVSTFDSKLTASNVLEIQATAMDLETRFPSFTLTGVVNRVSSYTATGTDGLCINIFATTAFSQTLDFMNSAQIGHKRLFCQWQTGVVTLSHSSYTLIGDTATTGAGTAIMAERTGATEWTLTLA